MLGWDTLRSDDGASDHFEDTLRSDDGASGHFEDVSRSDDGASGHIGAELGVSKLAHTIGLAWPAHWAADGAMGRKAVMSSSRNNPGFQRGSWLKSAGAGIGNIAGTWPRPSLLELSLLPRAALACCGCSLVCG